MCGDYCCTWLHSLAHTHTHARLSRSPPDEGSAGLTDFYMATHKTHKRRPSTTRAGFESAVPASERPQGSTCKGVSRCAVQIHQDAISVLIFLLEGFYNFVLRSVLDTNDA
jgi:hypothetical protein